MVLVIGVVIVGQQLWPGWPQQTELEFVLGPNHSEVVELRVAYVENGEELHGVSFGFPNGAPATVRHHVSLPKGELTLRCELRARNGSSRSLTRRLRAPSQGVVRIPLTGERS